MSRLRQYIEENHDSEIFDIIEGTGKSWDEIDDTELEGLWTSWHTTTSEAFDDDLEDQEEDEEE